MRHHHDHAGRLVRREVLVGFARARSRSKRVSSTPPRHDALGDGVLQVISSISALRPTRQPPRCRLDQWTPTRTRLAARRCCSTDNAFEGDQFLRVFSSFEGSWSSSHSSTAERGNDVFVMPSLKIMSASPDRFLNGSTATEGRASASRRGEGRHFDGLAAGQTRTGGGSPPFEVPRRKADHCHSAPCSTLTGQRLLLRRGAVVAPTA